MYLPTVILNSSVSDYPQSLLPKEEGPRAEIFIVSQMRPTRQFSAAAAEQPRLILPPNARTRTSTQRILPPPPPPTPRTAPNQFFDSYQTVTWPRYLPGSGNYCCSYQNFQADKGGHVIWAGGGEEATRPLTPS